MIDDIIIILFNIYLCCAKSYFSRNDTETPVLHLCPMMAVGSKDMSFSKRGWNG